MAQNQNIPRRFWKIETTHRGVATHSLRTTAVSQPLDLFSVMENSGAIGQNAMMEMNMTQEVSSIARHLIKR